MRFVLPQHRNAHHAYKVGRLFGIIPYAHLLEGSVIKKTYFGLTKRHVAARIALSGYPDAVEIKEEKY